MRHFVLAVLFLLPVVSFVEQASAARYTNPRWNNYALDWCKTFEQGCGQPAADLYCQKRGHPRSTSFQMRANVKYQTMTIGQNSVCNPSSHRCDSFSYIDCQETSKTFVTPFLNNYRLDWCKMFEQGCGQPAAQMYCQKQGYAAVENFQQQGALSVPTMTVGSHAVCDPKFHRCDGFSYIRCRK